MKREKNKPRIPIAGKEGALGSSMADLFRQAGLSQTGTPTEPSPDMSGDRPISPVQPRTEIDMRRVRIRCERKHRGGKTVTLLEGIELTDHQKGDLLKRMKAALGCGGTIEDETLVLQGDVTERVRKWLEANA